MIIQQNMFYSALDMNSNVYAMMQKTRSIYISYLVSSYMITFVVVRLEMSPQTIEIKVLSFNGKVARIEYCITE